MRIVHSLSRASLLLCFSLALAVNAIHAADRSGLVVTLDQDRLAHMETTLNHLAARFKTDPDLKKDWIALGGDQRLSGDTEPAVSACITSLYPKLAGAAKAEKWTPGDFYLTYVMFVATGVAEATGGVPKDAETRPVRRSMEFYEKNRVRCDAMLQRFEKVMGY